MPNGFFFFRMK